MLHIYITSKQELGTKLPTSKNTMSRWKLNYVIMILYSYSCSIVLERCKWLLILCSINLEKRCHNLLFVKIRSRPDRNALIFNLDKHFRAKLGKCKYLMQIKVLAITSGVFSVIALFL